MTTCLTVSTRWSNTTRSQMKPTAAPESRRFYTTVKYDTGGTEQWVTHYGGDAGTKGVAGPSILTRK